MTQGVEFRDHDQRVILTSAISSLNLERGSRISIEGKPYQVTALSGIVNSQGCVQLYYVERVIPGPPSEMTLQRTDATF